MKTYLQCNNDQVMALNVNFNMAVAAILNFSDMKLDCKTCFRASFSVSTLHIKFGAYPFKNGGVMAL